MWAVPGNTAHTHRLHQACAAQRFRHRPHGLLLAAAAALPPLVPAPRRTPLPALPAGAVVLPTALVHFIVQAESQRDPLATHIHV